MSTFATIFALSLFAQTSNVTEITLPDNSVVSEIATSEVEQTKVSKKAAVKAEKLEPFTGKISKNRVRLRQMADLSAPILKELAKDDLIIVTDLVDDFYAVKPASQAKGYIFRTYVLDGQVEGNHVNVRLEPDTNAPIICQMNSGDKVSGKICATNNKWLEIPMPESVRFFVAKEFVERIGNVQAFYDIEKLKVEVEEKLIALENSLQNELKKPFKEIQLTSISQELNQIICRKNVISQQIDKAKYLLKTMQEAYLEKSIAALQTKKEATPVVAKKTTESEQIIQPTPTVKEAETTVASSNVIELNLIPQPFRELEKKLLQSALDSNNASSINEFYLQEQKKAISLKGIIKPYARHVKNVPGDYMLIDAKSHLPIAYLYSTTVDLRTFTGKEAALSLVERPNNNFAYPAYFVLKAE